MAKTTNFGYTDVTDTKVLTIPDLNYTTIFRTQTNAPGSAVLTNVTAPLDQPEILKYGYRKIDNIYKNSGISPSYQAPTLGGVQVLIGLSEVATTLDSAVPEFRIDSVSDMHIVIKASTYANLTVDMLLAQFQRLVSACFDTDNVGKSRLESVLRGALVPKGL